MFLSNCLTNEEKAKYLALFQEIKQIKQDTTRYEEFLDIERNGLPHLQEYKKHCIKASLSQPLSSSTTQEPWFKGSPKFAYYTEVQLPMEQLPYSISTRFEDKHREDVIYIPPQGESNSILIKDFISQVIGHKGCFLKQITEKTGVHYIWYNKNPIEKDIPSPWGCFQIWGNQHSLSKAVFLLNTQIQHVIHMIHSQHQKAKLDKDNWLTNKMYGIYSISRAEIIVCKLIEEIDRAVYESHSENSYNISVNLNACISTQQYYKLVKLVDDLNQSQTILYDDWDDKYWYTNYPSLSKRPNITSHTLLSHWSHKWVHPFLETWKTCVQRAHLSTSYPLSRNDLSNLYYNFDKVTKIWNRSDEIFSSIYNEYEFI
jgi:hypothetical protein